ncbi:MAG: pyridoxal phosphate-dependent aminotransferase [Sphingomonas sp.]|nr:pyridoxal phosphate-dependent aminotransferase [Sphingomonas sp.]
MRSDYMHWAKFKPPVRYSLTMSEVPHFRMDSLPISIADLDLDGASHPRYAPLRQAIARRYGVAVEQVVTADGTSMANFLAMAALIAPGDEVLIEHPAYELLLGAASFLGADIKRFERNPADAFRLDPAKLAQSISERTRLIVMTNLHNPSSALAGEEDLSAVGKLAADVGARVLVDEVYLDSALPPDQTAARLGPEFVVTNSLTKVYGLSGLRCGWILAEPELAERIWRLNDLFGVNQAHPAERLACVALEHIDDVIGENPELLARNREYWNSFVQSRTDLECMPSEQGITAFPRWSGGNTERLDALLRERYDAAVVPGRWFELAEHFRVGFGLPAPDFEEAVSRLGAALNELR